MRTINLFMRGSLPLTGETPVWLEEQGGQQRAVPILLPQVLDKNGQPKRYGQGFVVPRHCTGVSTAGQAHSWSEQCFVTHSAAHAQRQRQAFTSRLARSEHALNRLRPRQGETREACAQRAHKVLQQQQTTDYFTITIQEKVTEQKRYRQRGRPTPTTPCELVTRTTLALTYERHTETIAAALTMAGWRVYVSNTTAEDMSLTDAIGYYRDEWQVEHGIHRFKNGSVPALPLAVRLPERIRSLMLLLFVALQALTLLDFVAARSLTQHQQSLPGLVPGNPQRQLNRPSAERLLAAFDYLHLVVETQTTGVRCYLVEPLSPLQCRILDLLGLSVDIYQYGKVLTPT